METAAGSERRMTTEVIARYEKLLRENVENQNTLRGYELNLRTFIGYAKDQPVTQSMIDAYKTWLVEEQKKTIFSANTTLSGVMKFINLMGWNDLELHVYPIAEHVLKPEDTYIDLEDYKKLVSQAIADGNYCIAMLVQTLCNMNIRYPEIGLMTVEALEQGCIEITRRKKHFTEPIPEQLGQELFVYAKVCGIESGVLFRTKQGTLINQKKVYRDLKALCKETGIDEKRVKLTKLKKPPVKGYYPVMAVVGMAEKMHQNVLEVGTQG